MLLSKTSGCSDIKHPGVLRKNIRVFLKNKISLIISYNTALIGGEVLLSIYYNTIEKTKQSRTLVSNSLTARNPPGYILREDW